MTELLTGKVCITASGAAPKGIGQATARLIAEHGARLVIADISADARTADTFLTTLGDAGQATAEVIAVRCDIADRQDCDRLVAAATDRFGRLDVLVNLAGIVGSGPMLDIDVDTLDRMISVNLKGAFNLCQSTQRCPRPSGCGRWRTRTGS